MCDGRGLRRWRIPRRPFRRSIPGTRRIAWGCRMPYLRRGPFRAMNGPGTGWMTIESGAGWQPLDILLGLLDLERLELNLFRGQNRDIGSGRLFGGQVLAQALVAAGRTVEGRAAHSLHGYFVL